MRADKKLHKKEKALRDRQRRVIAVAATLRSKQEELLAAQADVTELGRAGYLNGLHDALEAANNSRNISQARSVLQALYEEAKDAAQADV